MGALGDIARDERALLAALLCLLITVAFWSGSRYPDLGEKAAMGGGTILEDPLGFEAARPVDPADRFGVRLFDTTINWVSTNQRGMIFGIALAAAFMTLLRRLGRRSFEGAFSNTLLGVVIGAPLGVCVNCAAPIARGLHAAGTRLETSLAAMISSPTLNFVVLAMLFSMLPAYMAAFKVVTGLVFVVAGIPLLSRLVFRREVRAGVEASRLAAAGEGLGPAANEALFERSQGFGEAALWLVREFAKNLWFIVKYTVPLMLLAGALGALAVTLLPWDTLLAALPHDDSWNAVGWMVAIAAFGLLLPVPIAFDVVLAAALFGAGMPGHYVMVLLFSLGIFSIYSFLVVWEAVSLRVAATLSFCLLVLSVGLGVAAQRYEAWDGSRQLALFAGLADAETLPAPTLPDAQSADALLPALGDAARRWEPFAVTAPPGVAVERSAFAPPVGAGEPTFARHYGEAFGLVRPDHVPLAYKFTSPWYRAWPVAAGDVHGDGWPDLVVGSDQGVFLYANLGGERFVLQEIAQPTAGRSHAANLALVDLDDDGWLDVFVSTIGEGNHVLHNRGGRFPQDAVRELPEVPATIANGVAFGDLDADGRLDVVLGGYTGGSWSMRPPERSRNFLLRSRGDDFAVEPLPGDPGQTLSSLVSDLDADGHPEVLIGNDFATPDYFYWGGPEGKLRKLTRKDDVIPASTANTMSIDSADVDNDGDLEVYIAQVARSPRGSSQDLARGVEDVCREHDDPAWRERCEERMALHDTLRAARRRAGAISCLSIADGTRRSDCIAFAMLRFTLTDDRDASRCDAFPPRWSGLAHLCRLGFEPQAGSKKEEKRGIRQLRNRNVLLVRGADGRYEDRAKALGVVRGGWSWTARFADVDNDQWQDLYIANGFYASKRRESNYFYRNRQGQGFDDETATSGLESYLTAGAYVYVDFDLDGDLDIVTATFDGPLWVYRNQTRDGHAVVFELADARGNHFGVGSRVRIAYGDGLSQLRELKTGGGYVSSDAPRVHFGLGPHARVDEVEVRWPTGEATRLRGPFEAGHRYRIRRD
ncbi:MAG: FG-GAP-like repeat-containing protein [Myxococcota bacterium]